MLIAVEQRAILEFDDMLRGVFQPVVFNRQAVPVVVDQAPDRVGCVNGPEAAALIRKLMAERGLPVPPPNRVVDSICIVEICKERIWQ